MLNMETRNGKHHAKCASLPRGKQQVNAHVLIHSMESKVKEGRINSHLFQVAATSSTALLNMDDVTPARGKIISIAGAAK